MEVICLEEKAFYTLLDTVVEYVKEKVQIQEPTWISPEEAMKRLGIKSKTTLQRLRDGGKIRYSQAQTKIILYDSTSIQKYLEDNSKNTF